MDSNSDVNSRRTKIAILTPTLNRNAGGVERFASLLQECLTGRFEITLVAAPLHTGSWARRLGLTSAVRARKSRQALLDARPDVVITNGALGFIGSGPWRQIHVYHGTLPAHSIADRDNRRLRDWFLAGTLGGGICEFLSGWSAERIAVSESAAEEVRRFYRYRKVAVIENGVRLPLPGTDQAHRSEGPIFVGRRETRKGYDVAVEIAASVGLKLRVAGAGTDLRTEDLGTLGEEDLNAALARSVALIFPTKYEACSLAILEALALGVPVVTTPVGWTRHLVRAVPSYRALLADPADVDSMANILERLIARDPQLSDAVGKARDYVRTHNSLQNFRSLWENKLDEDSD